MSEKNSEFYTLGALVDQVMIDLDLPDQFFDKLLSWAIWALREINLDATQTVKTCGLQMNEYKAIDLPDDYVDWVKVGIQVGTRIRMLGVNSDMSELTFDEQLYKASAEPQLNINPNGISFENYGGYYFYNYSGKSLFGYGGGGYNTQNHFKVIKRDSGWQIQFDSEINNGLIYVEFIGDGIDPCADSYIHPYLMDYMRKSVTSEYYNSPSGRRLTSMFERREFRQAAYFASKKVRARQNDLDYKTMLNISRRYYSFRQKA